MINNLKQEDKVALMKHLINFDKVNETKNDMLNQVVEFKKKAANGKTYGIVRNSGKFYIMEAPQKDTEVLSEDFDYIGGFNNRKENEYSSYAKASNALDLKIMSINEAVSKSERVQVDPVMPKAEWQDAMTESMRNEINRFKTITENAAKLDKWESLYEGKAPEVPSAHTLPEAPAQNPSDKKVNSPFTDTAAATGDKDLNNKTTDHEKVGSPFNKDGEVSNKQMQSDKKPVVKVDATYTEKAEFVPEGAVANEHPKGGKVTRVSENRTQPKRLKLTLEQVLAWSKDKDYIDTSNSTHIGSSAPFVDEVGEESNQKEAPTEKIHEEVAVHNTDNQSTPEPGTSEVGDTAPYDNKVNEDQSVNVDDAAGMPDDEEDFSDYPFPDVAKEDNEDEIEDEYENVPEDEDDVDLDSEELDNERYNDRGMRGLENWQNDWNKFDDDDDFNDGFFEGRSRRGYRLSEDKLNVFGKHPGYRKKPMTTPPNIEIVVDVDTKDWNDESAKGELPFGRKIGSSAPFDKIVDEVTESIIRRFGKKKV